MYDLDPVIGRELDLLRKVRDHHARLIDRVARGWNERAYDRTYELLDLEQRLIAQIKSKTEAYDREFAKTHGLKYGV